VITLSDDLCEQGMIIGDGSFLERFNPPYIVDWLPWNTVCGYMWFAVINVEVLYLDDEPTENCLLNFKLAEVSIRVSIVPKGFRIVVKVKRGHELARSFSLVCV